MAAWPQQAGAPGEVLDVGEEVPEARSAAGLRMGPGRAEIR